MRDAVRRGFKIPLTVLGKAKANGIDAKTLVEMVRLSARVTHSKGNRRYEKVVFVVQNGEVIDVNAFDLSVTFVDPHSCAVCKGERFVRVFDLCPSCDGDGCGRCDEGLVPGRIKCPECR